MAIYKKDKNFFIDYYFQGRRKRECIGTDRKLAEIVLAKRRVEIRENKFLDVKKDSRIGLFEIIKDFLEYSKNSKRSYWRDLILAGHIKKFFGNRKLSEVKPGSIEHYRSKRLNTDNVSNSTVNRETTFLRACFNLSIRNRKATENPLQFVKKLQEPPARTKYLSKEEIKALLEACSKYLKPIVICALTTGMRKNEILSLKWVNVNLDKSLIHIETSKNGRSRDIPICGLLHRTLKECFDWSDGNYVFCNSEGQKYTYLETTWENTIKRVGFKDFRFHDLRHTSASYLVMLGIDLVTVKEILGHRSLDMTLRYAHLSKSHIREAIEILGTKMDTYMDTKDKEVNQLITGSLKTSSVE